MEKRKNPYRWQCLDGTALKILAMVCMLIDHAEGLIFFEQDWMSCVGRLAFPVFAFQIAEGYNHTRDFKKYIKRLLLFALIAEIPFNLMHGSPIFPMGQNVLFTFLLSLLLIRLIDKCRQRHWTLGLTALVLGTFAGYVLGFILMVDYAGYGVLTVLCFWVFGKVKWGWLIQLAVMIYLNCFLIGGYCLTFFWRGQEIWVPVQSFAVLAMIPILLYNGKSGPGRKHFRHAVYIFYPTHMLILGLLAIGLSFLC